MMIFNRLLFCLSLLCITGYYSIENSYSQGTNNTIIKGTVIDAKTKEPLPFVSVALENTSTGTVTDIKETITLLLMQHHTRLSFHL